MRRILLLGFASLSCTLGFTGCATPPKTEPKVVTSEELFDILDVNQDGFLTREELHGGLRYLNNESLRSGSTMFALTKKAGDRRMPGLKKKLTENQIRRLVEASFGPRSDSRSLENRLTREEFRTIVSGNRPGSENWQEVL